jgi:hypothetical protein
MGKKDVAVGTHQLERKKTTPRKHIISINVNVQ